MRFQHLFTVPPLLLIGTLASADAITGRVVDASGVGVAGVDIDFVRLGGGGNPHELNDGTDANGNYFTTVDPGIYEVRFFAPAPPTTTLLPGVLTPVSVSGTVNLGTLTLVNGVSIAGTAQNSASQPVGGIKVTVYNANTNQLLLAKNDVTSAFGTFLMAVPKNTPLRAEFLTTGVIGQTLVPRELFGTLPGNTNMGTLTFQNGFHLTGTVHRENGTPVSGADTDVVDIATNQTLFTPNDNTNTLGNFDVVVPAGTFELDVIRPTGQVLVGVEVKNLNIAGPTNVGVLTMRNGVFLSGTVRNPLGVPVEGADVNAKEVSTGLPLALGADNTNAAGAYSVVVPISTLHVTFSPPGPHTRMDTETHRNVVIAGNTVLDGTVGEHHTGKNLGAQDNPTMAGPIFVPIGAGLPGSGHGVPHLAGHSTPSGQAPGAATTTGTSSGSSNGSPAGSTSAGSVTLELFGGRPGARAELLLGLEEHAAPTAPWHHLVRPTARVPVTLDAEGYAQFTLALDEFGSAGSTRYAQFLVIDPGVRRGLALSRVLALQISQ